MLRASVAHLDGRASLSGENRLMGLGYHVFAVQIVRQLRWTEALWSPRNHHLKGVLVNQKANRLMLVRGDGVVELGLTANVAMYLGVDLVLVPQQAQYIDMTLGGGNVHGRDPTSDAPAACIFGFFKVIVNNRHIPVETGAGYFEIEGVMLTAAHVGAKVSPRAHVGAPLAPLFQVSPDLAVAPGRDAAVVVPPPTHRSDQSCADHGIHRKLEHCSLFPLFSLRLVTC